VETFFLSKFQESEIVFRATVTINATRERLEAASNERNGKILLGRPIVLTFKRVPKKVVTGATKVKARVYYLKKLKKKILKNQELDGAPENHLKPIPRSSLCQGRGCWALIWAKVLLRIHLFH